MHTINSNSFLKPVSYIAGAISEWRLLQQLIQLIPPQPIPFETRVGFMKSIELLKDTSKILKMTTLVSIIERDYERILNILALNRPLNNYEFQNIILFGEKVLDVFATESESRVFISPEIEHSNFLSLDIALPNKLVAETFPQIVIEFEEAGKCRALGLWTASVMHLMRALEIPIKELAQLFDVTDFSNWNTALNQIERKLKERNRSMFNEEEECWASEASAHLRAIKNAWRNYVQHGKVFYYEQEAIMIWSNINSLLISISNKVNDEKNKKKL